MTPRLLTVFQTAVPIACALGVAIVGHQVAQVRQSVEDAEEKAYRHTKDIAELQSWRDRTEASHHSRGHQR
jgi:hypothetical protein